MEWGYSYLVGNAQDDTVPHLLFVFSRNNIMTEDGTTKKKKKTREEIESEIREKVSCEEQAFRWVEKLAVVEKITKSELDKMVSQIMPNHYTDIVEERACSKVRGNFTLNRDASLPTNLILTSDVRGRIYPLALFPMYGSRSP